MIQFEANNEKVNWYSETEMRTLFNAVLSAYSKTTDINTAITSAINGLGNLSRINKSGNANEYLNGAGNWSTVSSGTTYTLPAATSSQLGGVKIGNNIANSSGTISVSEANTTTKGVTKLYTSTGTATDGTMTQAAIKTELDKKITSDTKVASAEKADSSTKLATARTINGFPFDGSSNIVFAGTCTTAADVAEKEVTIQGFDSSSLKVGTIICVNFTNANTAASPKLKINGGAAKGFALKDPRFYGGNYTSTADLLAGQVMLMYDGNSWDILNPLFYKEIFSQWLTDNIDDVNIDELTPGIYRRAMNLSGDPGISGHVPKINSSFSYGSGANSYIELNIRCFAFYNGASYTSLQVIWSPNSSFIYYRTGTSGNLSTQWRAIDASVVENIS